MQIAGLGYLIDGFAFILSPAFHAIIFPASLLPAFVAESSFCSVAPREGRERREVETAGKRAAHAKCGIHGPGPRSVCPS